MLKNNIKAKELSQSAKELLHEADSELEESSCQLDENLQAYIALRSSVINKSLKEFDTTYSEIKNIELDDTKLSIGQEELENINSTFNSSLGKIKDVHIQKVKSGSFGAFFKAIIYAVITFLVAVIGGILASGSNIYLDKMPQQSQITNLLVWFGNLIHPGHGDVIKGSLLLGGGIALVVFLVIFTKIIFRASQNLKRAKLSHAQADATHHKKVSHIQKTVSLSEYTLELATILKTLQIYMNEFNAVMHRIIHVEGKDFNNYTQQSKKDIQTAVIISKRINTIITTNIIAEDGEITPDTRQALEECENCVKQHTQAGIED